MRLTRSFLRRLRRDQDGATLLEFAFVAPVFVLMLMGLFEFGFQVYARSVLQGALQEAARDATLEGGELNISALDGAVRDQFHNVIPSAVVTFQRTNYANFSDVRQPEEFTDNDGDGECNNNEPFEDMNDNGVWDQDRGQDGLGGARVWTLDWNRLDDAPLESFDVILGCDVIYEAQGHRALLETCARFLGPGGRVFLADPGRSRVPEFVTRARGEGWSVAIEDADGRVAEPEVGEQVARVAGVRCRP